MIAQRARRVVYENRWMTVYEDDVRFPSGAEGIYGVVSKPDFVLIVPVGADGRLHLVEQFRYPVAARHWEFPQGSWETARDADPVAIAAGELAEETGLTAATMTHVGHLYEAYGFSDQGFHIYMATDLTEGRPDREMTEADMIAEAFPVDAVVDMITSGQIKDAPTVAALGLLRLRGLL